MADMKDIYVLKLVTDTELLLNVGTGENVNVGDVYAILDPATQNVRDPLTGNVVGTIDRVVVHVTVTRVSDGMSLAKLYGRRNTGLTGAAGLLAGPRPVVKTPSQWPEGVQAADPARFTGQNTKRDEEDGE